MARTINQHHYKNMALCDWHIRTTNKNNFISNSGPQKAFKAHVYPSRVHKFTPVFSPVRAIVGHLCSFLSTIVSLFGQCTSTASDYSFGGFKLFTCKYTYKTLENFTNSTVQLIYYMCRHFDCHTFDQRWWTPLQNSFAVGRRN